MQKNSLVKFTRKLARFSLNAKSKAGAISVAKMYGEIARVNAPKLVQKVPRNRSCKRTLRLSLRLNCFENELKHLKPTKKRCDDNQHNGSQHNNTLDNKQSVAFYCYAGCHFAQCHYVECNQAWRV